MAGTRMSDPFVFNGLCIAEDCGVEFTRTFTPLEMHTTMPTSAKFSYCDEHAIVWLRQREEFYRACRETNIEACAERALLSPEERFLLNADEHGHVGIVYWSKNCDQCGWNEKCSRDGHVFGKPSGCWPFVFHNCACGRMEWIGDQIPAPA